METIKFTQAKLAKLVPPKAGRVQYKDAVFQKLLLRHTASDNMSWYVRIGRSKRKVGDARVITPEEARQQAAIMLRKSSEVPSIAAKANTFGDAYKKYIEDHVKVHSSSKSLRNFEQIFTQNLVDIHSTPLKSLSRQRLSDLHRDIYNGKYSPRERTGLKTTANRALELVSAVLSHSIAIGIAENNPAKTIKRFKEESRDEHYEVEEARRLFSALLTEYEVIGSETSLSLIIGLLTGARASNVYEMEVGEVDLRRREWIIPAEKFKGRRQHRIYFGTFLAELLAGQFKKIGESPYVLPGTNAPHIRDNRKAFTRAAVAAEVTPYSMHSLRHTFISQGADLKFPLYLMQIMAGHKPQGITLGTYTHISAEAMREAAQKIEDSFRGLPVNSGKE